jgi:hypothetical protein
MAPMAYKRVYSIPVETRYFFLLFRYSIDKGIFPSIWKISSITPILKSGNPSPVVNYRPISILPHIAIIFELIVHNCTKRSFNHILILQKHDFRSGKSTFTSEFFFISFINDSFDHGHQVDVILTDFSKAFDTVDHGLLVNELESLGIGNPLLSWFRFYLSDRNQFVKIQNAHPNLTSVTSGVPQGGHLSPMLFSLFVNSISHNFSRANSLLYADDIKIVHTIKAPDDCSLLQDELSKFLDWVARLGLSLSLSKCQIIILTSL